VSAEQASAAGYTHHGSLYAIPVWLADPDADDPTVEAKWPPLSLVMMALLWLESNMTFSDGFSLGVGPKIGEEDYE